MKEKDIIPVRNEYSPQLSKFLYNWQVKYKEGSNTLKGSRRMGADGFF
jgi:hypothetical protein